MEQTADFMAAVVAACASHQLAHQHEKDYRAAVSIGTKYFVKFGDPTDLWSEIETQKYIHGCAFSDLGRSAPRIPRVMHSFEHDGTMYLVMEFIRLLQAPQDYITKVAAALVWLASVPAPPGHVLGPLGGGRIRHRFFKNAGAPLRFSSVDALERYLSRAYHTLLSSTCKQTVSPVELHNDRIMFSQSDMDPTNFGFDADGNTVLLDFGDIGLLPETFIAHTMFSKARLAPIAAALSLSKTSMASMAQISSVLWMAASPKLGLDEDGYPKAKVNRG